MQVRTGTDDPEEALRILGTVYDGFPRFTADPGAGFALRLDATVADGFLFADAVLGFRGEGSTRSPSAFVVSATAAGHHRWTLGGREGDGSRPLVLLPDQAARGRFDHLRTFSAAIPATAVHEALAVWRAGDAPAVTGDGSGAALQALLTHLGTTAAAFPGVLDQPLIRASAQQALVQALIASSAGIADGGRPEYATSRALRRALAFMEEHAAEPITVPAIAAEARMSVRGMQALFQRELGMTPAARLRRIRLDRARSELLAAEPHDGVSVATVAHRWGFAHLSRFAAVYREAFGEPPSRTLRR